MITDVFLDQKRVNVCEHMVKTAPHHNLLLPKSVTNQFINSLHSVSGKELNITMRFTIGVHGCYLKSDRNYCSSCLHCGDNSCHRTRRGQENTPVSHSYRE